MTSSAIGYSCVLFGMASFDSLSHASATVSFFGLALPSLLSPFASLVLVSVLVPASSFSGHVSGIIAGFITGALSLQRSIPISSIASLLLVCLISKHARSHAVMNGNGGHEIWDSA
jgi:phosphoglycerol transferase MdoB-like AlkP superfamily enzyme